MFRGPTVMGRKQTQINDLEKKEEINIQPEQNEETRIKKTRRSSGNSGTTLKVPISES